SNLEQFKRDLIYIARTTLCSKILQENKDHFSKLCVDAVLKLYNKNDLQDIQIIKCLGNNLNDSYIEHGFLLKKRNDINIPKRIENAHILIANILMNIDKESVSDSPVSVNPVTEETELESVEKKLMKDNVEKILQHNCNVFINRELINDYSKKLFTENNIMTIEYTDSKCVERLAQIL
ncbi:unnamed protein product, partial [Rotaria sp. Silwood2]